MSATQFKVIIVGGGPVGLTAANAFDRAGVDFILLERRPDVVIDAGSNLVLSPIGLRALDQLGLHDSVEAVTSALGVMDRFDHAGNDIGDMHIFPYLESNTGMVPRVVSRHDLTKVLHDGLSKEAQNKIHPNKNVSTIEHTPTGVLVTCADGTTYSGTIIIGADGAHSKVRSLMRNLALSSSSPNVNEEHPFLTTYRCLWVRFPLMNGLTAGTVSETHGPLAATQLFAGADSAVFGLYERLPEPTRARQRYTLADQTEIVDRWGHLPLTKNGALRVRDVYANKGESGLVSLEEGLVDHWSFDGKVVLVGDAAHKFTPSTGAGCNNGIIDVAALLAELQPVIRAPKTSPPSQQDLNAAFLAYQAARFNMVKAAGEASGKATASATWQTGIHKFIDQRVMSIHMVQRVLMRGAKKELDNTPSFEFGSVPTASLIKV